MMEKTLLKVEEQFYAPKFRDLKVLILLSLSASALYFSGYLFNDIQADSNIVLKALIAVSLTAFIYTLNDLFDDNKLTLKNALSFRMTSSFIISTFASYLLVKDNSSMLYPIGIIISTGVLYSIPFNLFSYQFKIKNIFLLKNLFIGLGWAALISFGAGELTDSSVNAFAFFVFLQVFIGSIIRDLGDIESDKLNQANTIPVVLGISKTLTVLKVVNTISILWVILTSLLIFEQQLFFLGLIFVSLWRLFTILKIENNGISFHLVQSLNLSTCFIIFFIRVIL